jgi:hypothetical protein
MTYEINPNRKILFVMICLIDFGIQIDTFNNHFKLNLNRKVKNDLFKSIERRRSCENV